VDGGTLGTPRRRATLVGGLWNLIYYFGAFFVFSLSYAFWRRRVRVHALGVSRVAVFSGGGGISFMCILFLLVHSSGRGGSHDVRKSWGPFSLGGAMRAALVVLFSLSFVCVRRFFSSLEDCQGRFRSLLDGDLLQCGRLLRLLLDADGQHAVV
jgi:hypothetical protein